MLDEKYFDEVITNLKNRLDRHDAIMEDMQEDIENLRMSETEIKVKLNSIETSTIELKAMVSETNARIESNSLRQETKWDNQNEMIIAQNEMVKHFIEGIKEDKKNENKVKLQDRKELWAIASAILSALVVKMLEMFGGK